MHAHKCVYARARVCVCVSFASGLSIRTNDCTLPLKKKNLYSSKPFSSTQYFCCIHFAIDEQQTQIYRNTHSHECNPLLPSIHSSIHLSSTKKTYLYGAGNLIYETKEVWNMHVPYVIRSPYQSRGRTILFVLR